MDKCQVLGDDGKEWNLKEKITMPLSIKHKNKFSLLEVNLTLWKRTHQWLFLSRETVCNLTIYLTDTSGWPLCY